MEEVFLFLHAKEFKPALWHSSIFLKPSNIHLSLTVYCGGGRGRWTDLHGGCQTPTWCPQQSNGKSYLMKRTEMSPLLLLIKCLLSVFMQLTVSRSQSVKAGTEEKLVLHLFHSFAMGDSSYISIFLSTYRSFTSTKRVLDILNDRWEAFITAWQSKSQININAKI